MVRYITRLPSLALLALSAFGQTWVLQPTGSSASLRGVSVVDAKTAWASGTGGTFLRTLDGGSTWKASHVAGAASLDFRGVSAESPDKALLMSSGDGKASAVYATEDGGITWKALHVNADPKGFFDGIAEGLVLGDPADGAFTLYRFDRAGGNWQRIRMPPALPNEAAFAASNSSLVVMGAHVWIASGGPGAARVYRSLDGAKTWSISKTPIRNDSAGAGIFSLFFADPQNGIAVGGDYSKPADNLHDIAVTHDGGVTWTEPQGKLPRGYRSSVVYLPARKLWLTAGPTGSEYSDDGGQNWTPFDDGAFNAIGISKDGSCWAVGPKGRVAKLVFDAPAKR